MSSSCGKVVYRTIPSKVLSDNLFSGTTTNLSRSGYGLEYDVSRSPSPPRAIELDDLDVAELEELGDCLSPLPHFKSNWPARQPVPVDPLAWLNEMGMQKNLYKYALFISHRQYYLDLVERCTPVRYRERMAELTEMKEEELFAEMKRPANSMAELDWVKRELGTCKNSLCNWEMRNHIECLFVHNLRGIRTLNRVRMGVIRDREISAREEMDALERKSKEMKKQALEVARVRQVEGTNLRRPEDSSKDLLQRFLPNHVATCSKRLKKCSARLFANRVPPVAKESSKREKLFDCFQVPLKRLCAWLRPRRPRAQEAESSLPSGPRHR